MKNKSFGSTYSYSTAKYGEKEREREKEGIGKVLHGAKPIRYVIALTFLVLYQCRCGCHAAM